MKNFYLAVFTLFSTGAFAQIILPGNTFPSSGNVGIGTSTPIEKLEVISTLQVTSLTDHAFIGSRYLRSSGQLQIHDISGLYFQQNGDVHKIQCASNSGKSFPSDKGFIEFSSPATANTTLASLRFGNGTSEFLRINANGKVRISATDIATPGDYSLYVEKGILTEKVKVSIAGTTNWADYVFADDYELMPLEEVEEFTKENKHLPNVPCAEDMVTEGLDVAKMDAKLLEKIEELTLYLIEQNKKLEEQSKKFEEQNKKIEILENQLQQIKEQQD